MGKADPQAMALYAQLLLTKHCFGNNWTYTFFKAFPSAETKYYQMMMMIIIFALLPEFLLCHSQVKSNRGWTSTLAESNALLMPSTNLKLWARLMEIRCSTFPPALKVIPCLVGWAQRRLSATIIIKSNQTGSIWKNQLPESAEWK